MKNTDKEFYTNWGREKLIDEVCRINHILVEAIKDNEVVEKNLEGIKNLLKEL